MSKTDIVASSHDGVCGSRISATQTAYVLFIIPQTHRLFACSHDDLELNAGGELMTKLPEARASLRAVSGLLCITNDPLILHVGYYPILLMRALNHHKIE